MSDTASTYEQERRDKLQRLRDLGIDPYGQRTENVLPLAGVKSSYKPEMGHDTGPKVTVAGRVMFAKRFGKLAFMTLRDDTGDLQVAIDKKRLNELDWQVQDLIDLGDQIVVTGALGSTKTGEVTVWATSVTFAAKALLPPPGKWHGLEDIEQRYRQRYVDLWANPEVMKLAKLRTRVIQEIRNYLIGLGYVEVETPMMQIQHGGAAARPFVTHHNALDIPLYMRIAPELFLKRLLVGGFSKVFEINRNFRNEGISPRHNPEFTMLEAYEAYGSWETMADMIEGMVCHIAEKVFGTLVIEHQNEAGEVTRKINLTRPWRRVRMDQLVADWTKQNLGQEWRFDKRDVRVASPSTFAAVMRHEFQVFLDSIMKKRLGNAWTPATVEFQNEEGLRARRICEALATNAVRPNEIDEDEWLWWQSVSEAFGERHSHPGEQLQYTYEKLIESTLIDPTFVTHVPSVIIPLAKENKEDPFFADVYELAINGVEISPGYTELNDPDVQTRHFSHQVGDKEEQQKTDDDFLNALRYGMPPAGGMGLGVDRLLMMLTGAESIRDVILFPLMRPTSE